MTVKVGQRVGAVCESNKETIRLFGYGVYDGDKEPPPDTIFLGAKVSELNSEIKSDCERYGREYQPFTNPRITLDNGKVVWGFQCWWGSEEKIKKMCDGLKVEIVNLEDEERKQHE